MDGKSPGPGARPGPELPGGPRSPEGPQSPSRGRPVLVLLVALLLTLVVAVPLGLWRSRDPTPTPGTVLSAAALTHDSVGDASLGAIPPPREPTSRDEWERLLPQLEKAAESGDITARRRLALALYNLRRLDETQALYEDLLRAKDDAVLRNRLGNVLRDRGELESAEAAYRAALAQDPTLPAPYVNLAEILWRTHRDGEAMAVLQQGLKAVPPGAGTGIEQALSYLRAADDGASPATGPPAPASTAPGPVESSPGR